jgi:pyruvate dehydrogenase E1 component alpha subunit
MGTHISRGTSVAGDLSVKAAAYGVRFERCDGMDVLATYDCFKPLLDAVRSGEEGPALVEARTYRYKGHSMSDPQKYRSKEEVAQREQHDPINGLVNYLIDHRLVGQEKIEELDKQAKQAAMDAVRFADESPETPMEEMHTDVYSQPFAPYKKGGLPLMIREDQKG